MTMSQVVTDSQQAGPMTNGCDGGGDLVIEPMDLSGTPVSNGTTTPTKMSSDELAPGQLSPASARRRSTRASALKAQEKIKLKDDGQPSCHVASLPHENSDDLDEVCAIKKRRLMSGTRLDQYSHTFYIKEGEDGEVCEVSDESEISSLHSGDVSLLRTGYEKLVSKELSSEQKQVRHDMIKRCESELRLEEARLILMKKINSSQMIAAQKAIEAKKHTPNIVLNNAGGAYEPTMALPKSSSTSNNKPSNSSMRNNPLAALAGLTSAQQQEFLARASSSNPQLAAQLLQLIAKTPGGTNQANIANLVAALSQQQQQQSQKEQVKENQVKDAPQSSHQSAAKAYAALTPQQRAANARNAFRQQADKQLTQIATPKSQPTSLSFIPNPNQPDFCYLVGLDLMVQRILRDRSANANVNEQPYECEECHTDFTPSWKAIGTPDDLHLYCEQCVHETQKKKIQKDHLLFLRKAFNKVNTQEKEFEKQIADGKLDAVMAAAAAQAAQAAQSSSTATTSQTQPQNLSTKPNGTSTPTAPKSATPIPSSTTKSSAVNGSTQSQLGKKMSNSMNMNQMQQQMAMMQQLMRANPMMAAMMGAGGATSQANGTAAMANMMQMYNPMMMQMFAAAHAQSRAQQQSQPNVAAMALLAQAAAQSAQAQGSGNSTSAAQIAQLAAMNPAANPQLMRQLQERFAEQCKRNGKK